MRRFAAFVLVLVLAVSASSEEFDAHQERRLFAVRDTNAARYAIQEARQALAAGRVLRALEVSQRVLDEMGEDFFLQEERSTSASVLWSSAPEVVREMLASLTPTQREVYERIAEPGAKPLLAEALRTRSTHGLREVIRRYGASRAGTRAARVLADIQMEAGHHLDAARTLQEGLRYAPADAGLWARTIDALAAVGDRRPLERLPVPTDLQYGAGESAQALTARRDAALAALTTTPPSLGWRMWGGTPARDATHADAPPMPHRMRAREGTDWQERRSDRVRGAWRRMPTGSNRYQAMLRSLRPLHPVVEGRTIYVADGRSVRAYDVYSAREVWTFDSRSEPSLPLLEPGSLRFGRTSMERAFSPLVVGDVVVATVEINVPYEPDRLQGVEITTYLPRRLLVALDKTTGRMRWAMGQDGYDRLQLGEMSIISPPVVAEGLVLAVGAYHDGNHNVSFLAFDLATGALRWQRPLGFGQQELNLFGSPLKELAASPIAVADGVAYASTGLGFIAAVDIRSGIPRWLASYDIIPIKEVELWYDAPVRPPLHAPSPPIVYGEDLIIAPTDGRHIHVFNKRTGVLRWRKPYVDPGRAFGVRGHLLGVVNDGRRDVVVLTDRELRARSLADGKTVWRGRFDPEGDRVLGRGAIADGQIFVPTKDGLQRFSLRGDGAFKGAVAWPDGADPGNLLPLGRVLIVSSRDDLQWFYDWAAIERDVAKRRKENPDDPTILLEAGEMYLRGGGEIERALKAFEEARRIAERSAPALAARAERGLFVTYLTEGDQRVGAFSEQAVASYRKALVFAQGPDEQVMARIRIHRALKDGDARSRIRNLQALIDEAGDTTARFTRGSEDVPARASALILLAREHLARERPAEAIDALQRVIIEERDAVLPSSTAGEMARDTISQILKRTGPLPYRRHEQKAKALLLEARRKGDRTLIARLLVEYPNAAAVNEALLEQARSLLKAGKPLEAAQYLQRLIHGVPVDHPLAPTALAALAHSYRIAGARGAAGATLARLEDRFPRARVTWDGRTQTGAAFAAAEREALAWPKPDANPPEPLRASLVEVHFEPVGDEEFARPVVVETDGSRGPAAPAPVALMLRGRELVVFDMRKGKVAWTKDTGPCQHAAYADGVLVLALQRELRGLDAASGKVLWTHATGAMTRDLQVAGGLVFVHFQDVQAASAGEQRIEAVDAAQGTVVWSRPLPRSDYRGLRPWGGHVLLQQVEYRRRTATSRLLIFDSFDGTQRHAVEIPLSVEGLPITAEGLYLVAGRSGRREQRVLAAIDLERGVVKWKKPVRGANNVCGITKRGRQVLVLRADGSLLTHQIDSGVAVGETRIYVTDRGRACPFPSTPILAADGRITMIPWARRPNFGVVCFDARTGKLVWDAPYEARVSPSRATLLRRGDVVCVMVSFPKNRVQHILVRLLDAKTGAILQEIEPEGLSKENWIPTLAEGHGTLIIYGKSGASIFRSR